MFPYFCSALSTAGFLPGPTFGSLVFTFSPPVNGFSFLVRGFNAQSSSNAGKIVVTTTTSGNVTKSAPNQDDGDINFIGYFQNDAGITSVAISPLTFQFSSGDSFILNMALDELRVYTREVISAPSSLLPTTAPSSVPTAAPSNLPTAAPSSLLDLLHSFDSDSSSAEAATIGIWSGAGSFFLIAIATVYFCRRRCNQSGRVNYAVVQETPLSEIQQQ